ncbi:putative transposase [Bacillus sp. OV166]|uniref:TnsA endonuclease N-terminal domain-containing protein n=1 Tax=Bacillus sp. OV166 TaxID=1882763 RepID=UPI000A2AB83F|nr:TnsA endonuclease N-terminal domain-containing protein [Bacillus sp. OV166]SMQ80267.1 putative transposase [Bacillus sp. OV166]
MTINDYESWCVQKELSEKTIEIISNIRENDPERRVRSGGKNVPGFYPSRKMGVTIQFESHTVELPFIYEKEMDENVLEYYDQPPSFYIEYKGKNRKFKHKYTPDFFVIKNNWIGWEECKTEEALLELQEKNPERYYKDENNVWRCPPGEKYAKEFGLSFRVRPATEINRTRFQNIQFLEDYLSDKKYRVPIKTKEAIITEIKKNPSIALHDLLMMESDFISADSVYYLIITREIFVDLDNYVISNYKKFPLYPDELTLKAFANIKSTNVESFVEIETLDFSNGSSLRWGTNVYEIINIDEENIWLMGDGGNVSKLKVDFLYELIEKGEIQGNNKRHISIEEQEIREIVKTISPEVMQETLEKLKVVEQFIKNPIYSDFNISDRTIRYWKQKYNEGEKKYNSGFLGLVPKKTTGNRLPKVSEQQKDEMEKAFVEHYENVKQKNISAAYKQFKINCKRKDIKPVTYKTFRKYLKLRPRHNQILARKGKKEAYKVEEFYWVLDYKKTPVHGVRPFEIVHIDHTQLEIELLCSETGENLGRPWITFVVDAFSRRVLAFYLTYDDPSYKSNMMVLRELVRRHKRMPSTIVVDGGKDFNSVYFDTLLAVTKVTKKERRKPRVGTVIERLFGTLHTTFIHNLLGNTQSTKIDVRTVTPSVNPKNNAVWTLELLNQAIYEFVYEIYDTTHHPTLHTTPRKKFVENLKFSGKRKQTFITDFEMFKMLTLPSTRNGYSTVQPGGYGIQINTIKYWDESFRDPKYIGKKVKVRFEPFDISVAYAFLDNYWVKLRSDYKDFLSGRTEKERKIASLELKQRNKLNGINKDVTTEDLVNFWESNDGKEATELQRKKDQASKAVINSINGESGIKEQNKSKDQKQVEVQRETAKPKTNDNFLNGILSNNIGGFGRFENG